MARRRLSAQQALEALYQFPDSESDEEEHEEVIDDNETYVYGDESGEENVNEEDEGEIEMYEESEESEEENNTEKSDEEQENEAEKLEAAGITLIRAFRISEKGAQHCDRNIKELGAPTF